MKPTFLLTLSAAAVFAASGVAHAQDMQMSPAENDTPQQNTQVGQSAIDGSGYGGTMSGNGAESAMRSKSASNATPGSMQTCTPGLSCNIYQGQ